MKRICLILLFAVTVSGLMFAGGEMETGRDAAAGEVSEGQLLPAGAVDSANYLQDFEFEKTNTGRTPLLFETDLLKSSIWDKGEGNCLRISLIANSKAFFRNVPGEFIIYFQNPEVLRDDAVTGFLKTELPRNRHLNFYFFDPLEEKLLPASNADDITGTIDKLKYQRKQYANNVQLQKLLTTVNSRMSSERSHVLWVTDENIVEKQADANFFNFGVEVFGSGNITLSYLGYGEVPSWSVLNTGLMKHNGNSYFADDSEEITEKISKDIDYFSRPAIEDITVQIVWSQQVYEMANFYPPEYYPEIAGFYPMVNNGRPRTLHSIGGMNFSETKRFLHYLHVPPLQTLVDNSRDRHPNEDGSYKIGTVYIKYMVPMDEREYYQQQDLVIEYSDAEDMTGAIDDYVFCDMIIQNTPLIIQEISGLVNNKRDYLTAIKLINTQKILLQKVYEIREDEAVLEDLELLEKYYGILFDQAKTMNLL